MTAPAGQTLMLTVLSLPMFTAGFTQTMVIPAVPAISRSLHTPTTWAAWVLTAYLLGSAVGMTQLGKLGDQFGKKRLLLISVVLFLLGTIGCVVATHISVLIACRIVQGLGGAGLPLVAGLIKDTFPSDRVAYAIGVNSALAAGGSSVAFAVAGPMVDLISWRLLFAAAGAVSVVTIILIVVIVPETPVRASTKIDWPGSIIFAVGLVAILLAITEANAWGWTSARTLGLLAAGFAALAVWVRVELHVPEPMVAMRMLNNRVVAVTMITAFTSGIVFTGAWFTLPLFFQTSPEETGFGLGASTTATGLFLLPGMVLSFFATLQTGAVERRFGAKWLITASCFLYAGGMLFFTLAHSQAWQAILVGIAVGIAPPLTGGATAALVVPAVRATETAVAVGVTWVARMAGSILGGQICAAVLVASTIGGTSAPSEGAFVAVFILLAAVAATAAVSALCVTPRRRTPQLRPAGAPE